MSFVWYTAETKSFYTPQPVTRISDRREVGAIAPVQPTHPTVTAVEGDQGGEIAQLPKPGPYARQQQHMADIMPRERALQAAQIMTTPVSTLTPDHTFQDAWELVQRSHLRHIPIIDSEMRPQGILSDRDLLREAAVLKSGAQQRGMAERKISGFMQTRVLVAAPQTEIREIARVMVAEHVGAIPIVDDKDRLCGILTRSDILRTVTNAVPLELWI